MKTVVIKIGTSSICNEKTFIPNLSNISHLVESIVNLQKEYRVVLVTSGAVGFGLRKLGLEQRPKNLADIQAVASVGQNGLMALYESLFKLYNVSIGQILLSRDNLSQRSSYLNAIETIQRLLGFGCLPIINENDSVCSSEIRFGDNDSLSAIVAGMIHADYLFILTDVDGLYTHNPRSNPDAKRITRVKSVAEIRAQIDVSTDGSQIGTGGMVTKLVAAELATAAGCATIITLGKTPQNIRQIVRDIEWGRDISFGTLFIASPCPTLDRLWWISHTLSISGVLQVDEGAFKAISRENRGSLFAAGIDKVTGDFNAHQCVSVVRLGNPNNGLNNHLDSIQRNDLSDDSKCIEIGRGIVNYSSNEISRIIGVKSEGILDVLGYIDTEDVISRDNLAIFH